MGIIEQHEDVWSRTKTVHGYAVDEVRSVLQKSIRRGLVEEAILAAFELYVTGPETEELLWRRLEIITIEDVGTGMVDGPILIEALNNQRLRWPRSPERWMFSAHAIRMLCAAQKDRTTQELAGWTEEVVTRGERAVEVQDFHIDMHTALGVSMGRGKKHWWNEGAIIRDPVKGLDSRWGDYLRRLHVDAGRARGGKAKNARKPG